MIAEFQIVGRVGKIVEYNESVFISVSVVRMREGKEIVRWYNNIQAKGKIAESMKQHLIVGCGIWIHGEIWPYNMSKGKYKNKKAETYYFMPRRYTRWLSDLQREQNIETTSLTDGYGTPIDEFLNYDTYEGDD